MKAIYKREVTSHLRGLIGWVAIAVMLFVTGIYFTAYNLQQGYPYFGYVLSSISFLLLFLCPALTMRTFAEERRQRTDQLLLTAPVSITGIVVGKYLALLTIFAIPTAVCGVYPLVLSQFGTVPMLETYATLLAFFLLGAACLAVGMFFSSITENQGLAAGIGIAVILFNYYSVSLSEYVASNAFGTIVALLVLVAILGAVIRYVTQNENLAYTVCLILLAGMVVLYFTNSASLEGLLPNIMTQLSLFERFSAFVNGIFDMTAIVYYFSVIVFFLFLSVQSLEKRRYN